MYAFYSIYRIAHEALLRRRPGPYHLSPSRVHPEVVREMPANLAIGSVTEAASGLNVEWTDGQTSLFHFVWLRDCCYCDECGDCLSSLRHYVPSLETLNDRPRVIEFDAQELRIEWSIECHKSTYSADWLHRNRYDDAARRSRRPALTSWDATIDLANISFDFRRVSEDDASRLEMHKRLISHGIIIIRNGPATVGGVLKFAGLCGDVRQSTYGAVFDLKPGNAIGTAGTTLMEVPPHSDEAFAYAPPGILALACIQPARDGGESVMVDGFGVVEKLRASNPTAFDLLSSWNHHYVRLHAGQLDQRAYAPIIAVDDDGHVSGIRLHTRASAPLDLPTDVMVPYLDAYHRLCSMIMASENQIRLKLESGNAVIFDNHRALHARSAFSDHRRHMQICGVPREKFHETYRLLSTRLGDEAGANVVLRAGACR